MAGKQRPLLLGSVGRQYVHAPVASQRKKYCIWALAVVVPFLLLFCLFPSRSSFRPSYHHIVLSQLQQQTSASKPRSDHHGHTEKLSSKMDPLAVGRMQNEESIKSTELPDRKSAKDKRNKDDHAHTRRENHVFHQQELADRQKETSPLPKKEKLKKYAATVPIDDLHEDISSSGKKTSIKKAAAKLPNDEDVASFGKIVADDRTPIISSKQSRKPNIDDREEDLSSFGKESADQNPTSTSKQLSKSMGVVESEESMDDDHLDEDFSSFGKRDADWRRRSKRSEQMQDDLEEEFSSIGKSGGGRSSASSKQKQKQGDADAAELLFLEREVDKKESQSKSKRRQASNDVGIELSEASSDSDEEPMIISEWNPDSRSASTQKKARKNSSPQQQDEDNLSDLTLQSRVTSKAEPINIRKKAPAKCNLSKGKWIRDTKDPLYTNETCPWISLDQTNCKLIKKNSIKAAYNNWRWKPDGCELERFQAKAFLKLMQRKSLAFIGDKLAKAQMQSLLCLLARVERPNLIYDDKANQSMSWHFSSSNFTLSMVWSPYLVQETAEQEGYKKLRLDKLDTKWAELVPALDVLVMGAGPLFIEPAAYVVKDEVVGCHACKTMNAIDSKTTKEMSLYSAYRAAMRSSIMGVTALPGFKGITVFLQAYGFEGKRYQNVSMEMKQIQEEEVEKARKRGIPNQSKVEVLETALQSNPISCST